MKELSGLRNYQDSGTRQDKGTVRIQELLGFRKLQDSGTIRIKELSGLKNFQDSVIIIGLRNF